MGMFHELVKTFERVIQEHKYCRARLYVEGLATQLVVNYLPSDEMEIMQFPPDLPPYLRFDKQKIYLDREKSKPVTDEEEAAFYQLYRTWDPRIIARAIVAEPAEPAKGRWKLSYDVRRAIGLEKDIQDRIGIAKHLAGAHEIEFVTFAGRLRELSEQDFSSSTRLTLLFDYPDSQ